MSNHIVTIDEDNYEDKAFRAFCECGWAGDHWIYADTFVSDCDGDWDAAGWAAYNEAADEGQDHLNEQGPDPELA